MSGRNFIDTNVFVYALDPAAPPNKRRMARALIRSAIADRDGVVSIQARYRLDWYGSIIVPAAVESGCTILFSEDLQDGAKYGGVQVANPFR